MILEYLCGATNSLDPYSAFLTPDQLGEVYSQIDGSFVGLGVELKAQQGGLVIVRVIPGSPAEQAGVRAGDRIRCRRRPLDRPLHDRPGRQSAARPGRHRSARWCLPRRARPTRQVAVRRQRVEVPSVDQVRIIDPQQGVAYLRLTCFQKTTRRDLEAALWRLHRDGMRSLIIDLRGNPGGLLVSSVDVADLFLDQGVIVSTHGRIAAGRQHLHGPRGRHLASALDADHRPGERQRRRDLLRRHPRPPSRHDRGRAKLRQGLRAGHFPAWTARTPGLRLTTAKFYSPTGKPYSRVGVEPDVVVHQTARPVNGALAIKDDGMLTAALRRRAKNRAAEVERAATQRCVTVADIRDFGYYLCHDATLTPCRRMDTNRWTVQHVTS